MENHPIPQDVTGFKFRLIGSITVKQFLYLLGAGAIALVFYLLPIPLLIKIPLMLLSATVGLSLAFVPIDGRPMDKMLMNFLKTLPAENQFIYKKVGAEMLFFSFNSPVKAQSPSSKQTGSDASKKALLFNQFSRSYFKPDKDEQEKVSNISNLFQEDKAPNQGFTNRVITADQVKKETEKPSLSSVVHLPTVEFEEASKPHAPIVGPHKTEPASTPSKIVQASQSEPTQKPTTLKQPTQTVAQSPTQVVPPEDASQAQTGIYMPNVLQGVVKDPRGKILPHVIVEILDSKNTPLRTFRTDQNGAFAAATPLPSGTYTIHCEDTFKKQEFEDVRVVMSGAIMPVVEIISVDQREKLRRELFGNA